MENDGYFTTDEDLPEQLWLDPEAEFWRRELERAVRKEKGDETSKPT